MAQIKRQRAKEAMSKIVERYGVISHEPAPGLDVLLDYFVNMVYAIELLMKVLADDWRVPNESRFRHNVGEMYTEIFKKAYTTSNLMNLLKDAILDQKFIYEPSSVLAERVPELEALWDELKAEYYRRNFRDLKTLQKTITMPKDFGAYLLHNVERFYINKPVMMDHRTKAEKVQMVEDQIRYLQHQIERLQQSTDEEPDMGKQMDALHQGYLDKLDGLRSCMTWNFNLSGNAELSFQTCRGWAVVSDFLG
jgi:hypothetical protein